MTPLEYLQRYCALEIVDDDLGIKGTAKLTRYVQSFEDNNNKFGCYKSNNSEWCAVVDLLQRKFSPPNTKKLTPIFTITGSDKIDANEEFYTGSLRRAYQCRASPDEIVDATRLAVLVERIKPEKAIQYAEVMFGLDCNTYVGNYCGCSPSTPIGAYALGAKNPPLATPDVFKSLPFVKCPPRTDPEDITIEDIIVSYDPSSKTKTWPHIALVQDIKLDKAQKAEERTATLYTCGWGMAGDLSKHYDPKGDKVTLTVGEVPWNSKDPKAPKEKIVGFRDDKVMRYILDASQFGKVPARTWGIMCDANGKLAYDV